MKKDALIKTDRYTTETLGLAIPGIYKLNLEGSFYVDIVKDTKTGFSSVWLYNDRIGIKEHLFGVPSDSTNLYNLIVSNIENQGYLSEYIAEYM